MPIDHSHIDSVKDHFNMNARSWEALYKKFNRANDLVLFNRMNFSIDFLCKYLKPGARILDAGCGAGIADFTLVKKGYFVYGIDISTKMIELCENSFNQNNIDKSLYCFKASDLKEMNLQPDSFDAVTATGFIEYQDDENKILEIFRRAIKPGGILVCTGPAKRTISNLFGLTAFLNKSYNKISINRYSISRFKTLLKSNGFSLIDYVQHGYSDFVILHKLFGPKIEFLLYRALTGLSNFLPINRFANDIITVARNDK